MRRRSARIESVSAHNRTAEQQELINSVGREKNIYTTLINHPELFRYFHTFAGRLRRQSILSPKVRETLILRTAFRTKSGYEWMQHYPLAIKAGVDEYVLAQLDSDSPQSIDNTGDALIAVVDQLVGEHYVHQDTWDVLATTYDNQHMIEICMLVGNYAMIAGILNSLHVPLEAGQEWPEWAVNKTVKGC